MKKTIILSILVSVFSTLNAQASTPLNWCITELITVREKVEVLAPEAIEIVDGYTDLDSIEDKASIIDAFFSYAQEKQKSEATNLIVDESLNEEQAKRYILNSLKREYASENGTELNEILPKLSPLNPQYLTKKQSVFEKISAFVDKFKGVGGEIWFLL